jgi:hypothetical protein
LFLVLVVVPVQKCTDDAMPLKTELLQALCGCGRICEKDWKAMTVLRLASDKSTSPSTFSTINKPEPVEKDNEVILNQQLNC